MNLKTFALAGALGAALGAPPAHADENLFGYLSGAETLPQGANEAYLWVTHRTDKGIGHYSAYDVTAEYERGLTSRLTGALALRGQSIDTHGIVIDGYLPGDREYGLRASGLEAKLKYKFLSPLIDGLGLAGTVALEHNWLDPHSGRDKDTTSLTFGMQLQKNFLDDQLISVANFAVESAYAVRKPIADLPPGFDWPTDPEMEIELTGGAGLTYRVAPRWFVGAETFYQSEFETEVGQERWSWHAGPSVHYAARTWWATLTWLRQIKGGGETYPGQTDTHLHLVEKTKQEVRFKLGYNF